MGPRFRPAHVVIAVAALVAAACGTRLPDEAFVESTQLVEDATVGRAAEDGRSGASTGGADAGVDDGASGAGGAAGEQAGAGGAGSGDGGGGDRGAAPGAPPDADRGGGGSGPNQASDAGITADTVRVGTIVAENGVLGDTFAPAARGIRAWMGQVNASGGIHGRQVELFTCDDREDRSRSLDCARRLVEQDEVFAIVATNTRALGGAAPYLAEQRIPVFGIPITNAFYRWDNFFSLYGGPYERDGEQTGHQNQLRTRSGHLRWFKDNLGVRKAAVVMYDIAESAQAGEFTAKGLELEGYDVKRYTVSFAAPSFDQIVADMARSGTEIVFDTMDDGANRRFCDTLARRGYQVKAKVSTVVAMGQSLGQDFNEECRNVIYVTGSSAPYTRTAIPTVARFREAYDRYQPGAELHQWALEGYVLGTFFADALDSLGAAPTRADLIETVNARGSEGLIAGTTNNEGYQPADFSAERVEHCFAVARWRDSEGGWIQATEDFPQCYPDAIQFFTPVAEQGD